jgi:AraC family transcriptional regulator of adaptative response / DNA-3-methyladenine glycosylase II
MDLDPDRCWTALCTHDARFDGRFFVGVTSTGIYCRPVCSGRTPKRENCTFHRSAAAAEAAGFRPCLRCRPELAPGLSAVDAQARLARRAASLLEDAPEAAEGMDAVARRLGVTDRHLRRVFGAEFGVPPVAFAQTQRLLLAKRLLTDTDMPVTQVALASGFGSLRRFNGLFRSRYQLTPTDLRRRAPAARPVDALRFEVAYRPPYDWARQLAFLEARSLSEVESVEPGAYRRSLAVEAGGRRHAGWVEVTPAGGRATLAVRLSASLAPVLPAALSRVKHLFDTDCDPLAVDEALGALAAPRPGLRLPGAVDGFEVMVRAVLGQQVTVRAARTLARRFVEAFGEPVETPFPGITRLFPSPQRIAAQSRDAIAALGIIGRRADTLRAVAAAIVAGELDLRPGADVEATLARLTALPGIGDWTAQYVAMRALAWPDAFPAADYGVMKALGVARAREASARAEGWRPWRAYAVMHLWHSLH